MRMKTINRVGKITKGYSKCNMTQFTVRIPNEWIDVLNAYIEARAAESGSSRVSDVLRELIYKNIVEPVINKQ